VQCKGKHSQDIWLGMKGDYGVVESLTDPKANEFIEALKLARLGEAPGNKRDNFDTPSYADFASEVEKRNPTMVFDKDMMDRAFNHAVALVPLGMKASFKRNVEKMSQRVPFHA
jgi:hypothetical protein